MFQPVLTPNAKPGVSRPASRPSKPKPGSEFFEMALAGEHAAEVGRLVRDLDAMEVLGTRPNRTGSMVEVCLRLGTRNVSATFHPDEGSYGKEAGRRTYGWVLRDLLRTVAGRKAGKSEALAARGVGTALALMEASGERDRRYKNAYFSQHDLQEALLERVVFLHAGVEAAGVRRLCDAINSFVGEGGLGKTADAHHVRKAMESFKKMAVHALRHGATLEMLQQAVDESLVEETMGA